MFAKIDTAVNGKLWKHQREAVDFAVKRLTANARCSLIRMPTGTGKTGVIACLSMLSNSGSSLVLTPWSNLRDQMVDDLRKDFWRAIGLPEPKRRIEPLLPAGAHKTIHASTSSVYVSTFATINELRRERPADYQALANAISIAIVDEGHYEPAVEWGKSVKGLNKPTLLLTATPYRNDLKLFQITDPTHSTQHLTHKNAVEAHVIRELEFRSIVSETDVAKLAAKFSRDWKNAKTTAILPSLAPRAIVCCLNSNDIESAVAVFLREGLKAVGIHERFGKSGKSYLRKDVPRDPKSLDAEIWVHQHKLTEGLDDHRFCCLAVFTPFRNDRKMVQQLGRILRRDKEDRDVPALCFSPLEFSPEDEWDAYREFEPNLELLKPQHFRDVVDSLLNRQPTVEYFEGRFRRRFSPADLATRPQVIIPPSVLVRTITAGFNLSDYTKDCTDVLNTQDAVILGPNVNGPCKETGEYALWVYASVRNSRFLQKTSLYEISLETHCVVVSGGYLFIADSRGNLPEEYVEQYTTSVPHDDLERYLDERFHPTSVSVSSSIPYDTVVRRADLRGHNLLNVAASLTDRLQICRRATGSAQNLGRRHVGMFNGRIRDEVPDEKWRTFGLDTFVSWSKNVAGVLGSHSKPNGLFARYMPTCMPPAKPVPKTIALDLLRQDVHLKLLDGSECQLKYSSTDVTTVINGAVVTYSCTFLLSKGGDIVLGFEYDHAKRRFWFTKVSGTAVSISLSGAISGSDKSFIDFLNQAQDNILIGLEGGEVVYQGRNFFKVDYTHAEEVLLALIQRPVSAPVCATEKGTAKQLKTAKRLAQKSFPGGSLFRAIADRKIDLPFIDDILICADMGTECADFVAANFAKKQLALIHAKTGSGTKVSASAFHEVASQAMKNLVYLTTNKEVPKGVKSWRSNILWNKTGVPRLCRGPAGTCEGKALWAAIKSDIIGSSNPELYVVLVTSGCCDLKELQRASKTKRTPELAQLFHLLDGLHGYARQLGVRLLIRDLPQ